MPDSLHTPAPDLLSEVAAALASPSQIALADLLALAERVDAELATCRAQMEQARTEVLDPAISFDDAQARRQTAERIEHEARRLAYALRMVASALLPAQQSRQDEVAAARNTKPG